MKKQVIVIHGGEVFASQKEYINFLKNFNFKKERLQRKGWTNSLPEKLGKNYEVFYPLMPDSYNARYSEWKIWFERLLPILNKEIILIGNSLGGLFLTKYLSENKISKKINGLFLVAAPFGDRGRTQKYFLADFCLKTKDFSKLIKQCKNINFYHSKDDGDVPIDDFEKYKKQLIGFANFYEFKNRGHFGIKKFSEILNDIKNL